MSEKDIKGLTIKELQEKLKKIEQDFDKLTSEYEDEIERLNNIINELEKYCEKERATSQFVHECNAYNDVLMKLKELKEKSNGSLD